MTTLTPEDWAQVRAAYEACETPVEDICVQYDISSTTLRNRMRRWGWTRRRPPVPLEGPGAMPFRRVSAAPSPLPACGERSDTGAKRRWPGEGALPTAQRDDTPPHPMSSQRSDIDLSPHRRADARRSASYAGRGDSGAPPGEGKDEQAAVLAAPADLGAQLQSAVARVLPAIEAIIARLAAGSQPREMEQAGRALSSLTRTLRELNGLLAQHNAQAGTASRCAHCADLPEDMDAFRNELARRIDAFIASRQASGNLALPGEPGADGEAATPAKT